MNFPLWWDEAFVGANFLRRGYLDLLRPLDFGQVCPLFFVWTELSVVKLFGFSEMSLRLFPLGCGVASVLLFRHTAGRVLGGAPRLLAVAIFAMAYHPIRHAADVKPYSSDLLVALVLLAVTVEWLRARERTRWLWLLAAFAPLAIGLSYPAAFVCGGIGLSIGPAVLRKRTRAPILALVLFHLLTAVTFVTLFLVYIRAQAAVTMPGMSADWAGSFLPLWTPLAVPGWLLATHTGSMLAYPCGGDRGASALTLLAVVLGAAAFWRRGHRAALAACVAPMAVALVASALRRYPYGGATRFMLYTGPALCLLAGAGLGAAWARIPRPRLLVLIVLCLAAVGVVPVALDFARPYRSMHAERARQFARSFWPVLERDAEPVCLIWDFGMGRWNSIHLHVAVYLCNQKIYSPSRRAGNGPRLDAISDGHPLACVLVESPDITERDIAHWLEGMRPRYRLVSRQPLLLNMAGPGSRPRPERYTIFRLVPTRHSPVLARVEQHAKRHRQPTIQDAGRVGPQVEDVLVEERRLAVELPEDLGRAQLVDDKVRGQKDGQGVHRAQDPTQD
jgi:hypothetical protein